MIRKLIQPAAVLVCAAAMVQAQTSRRNFAQISAGAIAEQSEYNVRSAFGATGAFAVGRVLTNEMAIEGRFSASGFPAPQQITPPGFCRFSTPCKYPTVAYVRALTLGVTGEYAFAPASEQTARGLVLFGIGARVLTEESYRSNDTRPYAEAGLGFTRAHWGIRLRYELSPPGDNLPTWMSPITLDYRF